VAFRLVSRYVFRMALHLEIPQSVVASARIPPSQLDAELRRRLAAALYSDGIIGGAAACDLAGMEKAGFQYWLGENAVAQPLGSADFVSERQQLEAWLASD
jgi:hypothetical protein